MKATLHLKIKLPLNLPLFDTMFNIDWDKFTRWLLPSYLKKERHLAWLKVMLSGLIALHQDLLAFRTSARARAAVTSARSSTAPRRASARSSSQPDQDNATAAIEHFMGEARVETAAKVRRIA